MIKNIAIVILLFSLILLFKNQPSDGSLVKDTVITVDSVYVPYPEYVTVEVIVPAVVDTQAIINAHFEKRVFSDSVKTRYLTLFIRDTVTQNSIVGRDIHYRIDNPIIRKSMNNEISLSLDVGLHTVSLMGSYRHKRIIYRVGYDLYNRAPMVGAGISLTQW